MSPRQRIRTAAQECFKAYAEYSRTVYHIDVLPAPVHATYFPGRGEKSGWTVNGRYYGLKPAAELEHDFLECARQWREAIQEYRRERAA